MKTLRSLFNILLFIPAAGFFFAGCYTHMESMSEGSSVGRDSGDDYVYNDSTNSSNDSTGANYFSDDDYRESNYRASFDYYCPPAYIWGSNICYDPWYDQCWYPGPYWTGYSPYWGWGYGYWPYYGGGFGYRGYRGEHGRGYFAGRTRTIGSTRGGIGYFVGRGAAGSRGGVPYAGGTVSSRARTSTVPVAGTAVASQTRSRQEVPWWQRAKASTVTSGNRNRVADQTQSASQRRNTNNPVRNATSVRQSYQQRGRMQPTRVAGSQGRQSGRQGTPHYSSPQRSGGRSSGGGWSGGGRSSGGSRGGGGGGGRSGGGRGR